MSNTYLNKFKFDECRLLLVGAGGIGCEVLKSLTLSGFNNIDVIDLDTIDVSNLNRQFLFNKSHVGKSKSEVAVQIAKENYSLKKDLNLNAIHNSVMSSEFDRDYFKKYTLVINALDNRAARSHVNRMCLNADVPLIESGTEGYLGQVSFIKKSMTACYECDGLRRDGRTYATCTIRNTPSQPIHCIVWAKYLFHQLFGDEDPDNDVSPQVENGDTNENENVNEPNITNGDTDNNTELNSDQAAQKEQKRLSTREWAVKNSYDTKILFEKLFNIDIHYLLSMDSLWKERQKPEPLDFDRLENGSCDEQRAHCSKSSSNANNSTVLDNQRLWSCQECLNVFTKSIDKLRSRMKTAEYLEWDKDDEDALNFVTAASNLRSLCFNIERKSKFDVKSLAGNIIPAISSTNAIIGGLIVLQTIRVLKKIDLPASGEEIDYEKRNKQLEGVGKLTYLRKLAVNQTNLISSYEAFPPNTECLACTTGKIPEVQVHLSLEVTTLMEFVDKIVIGTFHFVCPDISLDDDSGTILYSKDEDESSNEILRKKKLSGYSHLNKPKTRLVINDLLQDKCLIIIVVDEKIDAREHKDFFYVNQANGL